jgi:hypothetical protein
MNKLTAAEDPREKAAQARQEAVRTRANNDAIYKLQSDRVREVESPTQRVQRERGSSLTEAAYLYPSGRRPTRNLRSGVQRRDNKKPKQQARRLAKLFCPGRQSLKPG